MGEPKYDPEKLSRRITFGRKKIQVADAQITHENVSDVLKVALLTHTVNQRDIDYLSKYYRGKQPIISREKAIRPEICNITVFNYALRIVGFKTGYLVGEPIQYIGRGDSAQDISSEITKLNTLMHGACKAACDKELVEWQHICGTAYRVGLPATDDDDSSSVFSIAALDPRQTFVVYSAEMIPRPIMGVWFTHDADHKPTYYVYTDTYLYKVSDDYKTVSTRPHILGMIPIIEYPANNSRLGAFEIVLTLLDAINNLGSNRLDGVEQTIQAFLKFINCEITLDEYKKFTEQGAIMVKSPPGQNADVGYVEAKLDQNQSQTLKDDLYQSVIEITGMPNRNGGSSTSDTGAAVVLRDGWELAESIAKDSELVFKASEVKFLNLILRICENSGVLTLNANQVDAKFTRRYYENALTKAQVLASMLGCEKIHPFLGFSHCGLFSDPVEAHRISDEYFKEREALNQLIASTGAREGGITQTSEKTQIAGATNEN